MYRLQALILGLLMIASPSFSDGADVKWPDCYCTDKSGARLELGDVICMSVGGRDFMARCEMSLNTPMWREISGGCLSSHLRPNLSQPMQYTPLVYPQVGITETRS